MLLRKQLRYRFVLIFIVALGVLEDTARGQTPFTHAGLDGKYPGSSVLPNEQVDPASGALLVVATDLVLPGNGALDLRVTRVYNSAVYPDYDEGSTVFEEDSWAGIGWRLHFGRVINPTSTDSGVTQIEMGDGGRHALYHSIEFPGLWTTTGFWVYDKANHTLKLPNGLVYTFGRSVFVNDRLGTVRYVTEIRDPFNNRLTFDYFDASGPPDGVWRVQQHLSPTQVREVTFSYDAALKSLATMTYLGYTWTYHHDAAGPAGFSVLRSVDPPIGTDWVYDYAGPKVGELTRLTTPSGGHLNYSYVDSSRRAGALTVQSRVVQTRSIDGPELIPGTWTYAYGTGTNEDTTTVTCPCGMKVGNIQREVITKYTFNGTGVAGDFVGWKSGTLAEVIVEETGATLERRTFTYRRSEAISGDAVPGVDGVWSDTAVYTALPELTSTTRGSQTWSIEHLYHDGLGNFNDYGRPYQITEIGENILQWRRTTQVFQYGFTPYICGRLASGEVKIGPQIITSSWAYDAATGFMTGQTLTGFTTTFQPSTAGNVAVVINGLNKQTTFSYSWGRVSSVQTPEGVNKTYAVEPDGLISSETTAGLTTAYIYDPAMRIQTVRPPGWNATPPKANVVTYTYDNLHHRFVLVARGGAQTRYDLDGFGQAWTTSDQLNLRTRVSRDACNRVTFGSAPFTTGTGMRGTTTVFDGLGRVREVWNAAGKVTTLAYTGIDASRTEAPIDGQPRTTHFDYQAYGDPANARLMAVTDAMAKPTSYTYDVTGALATVTGPNPGVTRTWVIDARGLPLSDTQPESGTTSSVFDAVGNLTQVTDANQQVTTLTYDDNNRLTVRNAPGTADDLTVTYENGRTKTLTGGGSTTTFDYETETGRTKNRTDVTAAGTFVSVYGYDPNDTLTQLTYPSGRIVHYDYIGERLATIRQNGTTFAQDFHYDDSGRLDRYKTGAVTHTFAFDVVDRLESLTAGPTGAGAAAKLDLLYGYDNVGNVRSITDPRPGASQAFTVDPLDRLATATGPWPALGWTYDNAGNRLTEANGAATTTYAYHAPTQRLTSTSGGATETFTYDNAGQLSSDGVVSQYTYLPTGKLETATRTGVSAIYTYDAAGSRLAQSVNGQTTYTIRALSGETLSEYVGACSAPVWSRDVVYAGGRPIGAIKTTATLQPTVALTTAALGVGEAAGTATIQVRMTTPSGSALTCPVTATYQTTSGTATAGADFTTGGGTVTFETGTLSEATRTVTVAIANDAVDEADETFTVGLSGATGAAIGTLNSTTVTILDDDLPHATFNLSAISVGEANSAVSVDVRLITAVPLPVAVSVTWDTLAGTATPGQDYVASSGTVTFPQGATDSTLRSLVVSLVGDGVYEGNETFSVRLTGGSGVLLVGATTATVTIIDNEPVPDPLMTLYAPVDGASGGSHVLVSGWAIDRAAAPAVGVDAVHVYAYPNADETQPAIFLGAATTGLPNGGSPQASSAAGFELHAVLPGPGVYRIRAFAHSPLAGSWNNSAARTITVGPTPRMWVDTPVNGSVAQTFTLGGWAIDAGAGAGTGVDLVQAWAYPNPGSGQPPVFVGTAAYGGARPDVAQAFGSQFAPSHFSLTGTLNPGYYQVVVFAHSTVTGTFSQSQSVYVTVTSGPQATIETPGANWTVTQPFTIAGWAIDVSAPSGTGVSTVHVWAYPYYGGPPSFVGVAAYGGSRPDVGAVLQDSRFNPSGYSIGASGLAPGWYVMAVFPYSTVAGGFTPALTVTVYVQ